MANSGGLWTIDNRDVIGVNTGPRTGGYIQATVMLRHNTKITGMVLTVALERLERELAHRLLSSHDWLRVPWLRRWIKPPLVASGDRVPQGPLNMNLWGSQSRRGIGHR